MVWVILNLLTHRIWQLQFLDNHLHHDVDMGRSPLTSPAAWRSDNTSSGR